MARSNDNETVVCKFLCSIYRWEIWSWMYGELCITDAWKPLAKLHAKFRYVQLDVQLHFFFSPVVNILPFNCSQIMKSSPIAATSRLLSFLSPSLRGSVLLHLGPKPESIPWIVLGVALTAETVAQSQDFEMSFALKFFYLQNNWKVVMIDSTEFRRAGLPGSWAD